MLEPLRRWPRVRPGVIWCWQHRQAEHYPVMKPGFAHRGLSADALIFQKPGNTLLARHRPGIEAKQITQGVTAHPARALWANFDRSPDAGNNVYRIPCLCHDYPSIALPDRLHPAAQRHRGFLLPESRRPTRTRREISHHPSHRPGRRHRIQVFSLYATSTMSYVCGFRRNFLTRCFDLRQVRLIEPNFTHFLGTPGWTPPPGRGRWLAEVEACPSPHRRPRQNRADQAPRAIRSFS